MKTSKRKNRFASDNYVACGFATFDIRNTELHYDLKILQYGCGDVSSC